MALSLALGRILLNQVEAEDVLKEGNLIRYKMVDLAELSFAEQLKVRDPPPALSWSPLAR